MKLSEKFYIAVMNYKSQATKREIMGKTIIIEGFEKYNFFIHKATEIEKPNKWVISEKRTGMCITRAITIKECLESAQERLIKHSGSMDDILKSKSNVIDLPDF